MSVKTAMLILIMILSLAGFAYLAFEQNNEITNLKRSLEETKSQLQEKDALIGKQTSEFQVLESQVVEFKAEIERTKSCTGIIDNGECLSPSAATRKSIENDKRKLVEKETKKTKKKKRS